MAQDARGDRRAGCHGIVPGHGEPLRDKFLLRATMRVMQELLKAGKDAKARGLDPDQAREGVFPRLRTLMVTMIRDDPKINEQFRLYVVDWYMHRVYDEHNGPLTERWRSSSGRRAGT